jgi:hypothetical protein
VVEAGRDAHVSVPFSPVRACENPAVSEPSIPTGNLVLIAILGVVAFVSGAWMLIDDLPWIGLATVVLGALLFGVAVRALRLRSRG